MPASPAISIIVLNWNGLADTTECLRSLQAIDYPNHRIVAVDNGSDNDEAAALRREFGDHIELIESERNLGFAGGANLGIRRALEHGADYVLLLNNDTTVDPAFLSELIAAIERLPDAAAACPKAYFYNSREVIYSTGGNCSLWKGTARQIGRGQRDRGQFEDIAVRGYADGVCMLIPRRALERVGLLDEDFFMYWEETDWCARARSAGLKCYYVPKASIWHKAARSEERSTAFQYLYRRNALLFVRKRGSRVQLATALLMHLFVYGPLYFLRHPTRLGRAVVELKALVWHTRNRAQRRPLL